MKRFGLLVLFLSNYFISAFSQSFITVRDGRFYQGEQPYSYIGANLWYGAILGSEGQGGDRRRLCRELDDLRKLGVTNVRVLVGGEGNRRLADHIEPNLQPRPGEYNDTLLAGLDYLMVELGKRKMHAVLYLHNAWQWSGGFGTYLEWAGEGQAATISVWNEYTSHHSKFVRSKRARELALRHTRFVVSRINSLTGRAYSEDPALMSWEICNEPRPFARDSVTKTAFLSWIQEQAQAIKAIDPRHLVTTGSEGLFGCEMDIGLYQRTHALPEIDYLCIHIWPYTWTWVGPFISPNSEAKKQQPQHMLEDGVDVACQKTSEYIRQHVQVAQQLHKPLVLEEFGYPRDGFEIAQGTPTTARDRYYDFVLRQVNDAVGLAGCNFWAWGGRVRSPQAWWHPFAPYTGDPAQEEQGLYSVFPSDRTTVKIIRKYARDLRKK